MNYLAKEEENYETLLSEQPRKQKESFIRKIVQVKRSLGVRREAGKRLRSDSRSLTLNDSLLRGLRKEGRNDRVTLLEQLASAQEAR